MSDINFFKMNKLDLCEEMLKRNKRNLEPKFTSNLFNNLANRHVCNQSCIKTCKQLIVKSISNLYNTLPNNPQTPIIIESKRHPNLDLSNSHLRTSNFSNFSNYRTTLDNQNRQRSKYFDVYYPKQKTDLFNTSSKDVDESDLIVKNVNENETPTNTTTNKLNDEINKFNLHINPIQFNMDKVSYVKTLGKAKQIVDVIQESSKVISMNCDSDCCLQNGIDLLEIAVTYDDSLDHPDIYVFDIHLEPKIIDLFKPVFANSKIIKVMFDARFDMRILSRKYGVFEFAALFDLQLAYRVLLAKITSRPFEEVKREKLFYVSWQCNGPLVNFEKMYLPRIYYFKNKKFWRTRPINFEIMYNAAYDVFVMVPQLFTNLMIIMERTLDEKHHKLFIKYSNDLITRNLVSRKFAFFQTKHEYLGEMHRQIDLLIQSDILHRNKRLAKWQQQLLDEDYVEEYQDDCLISYDSDLLKNQISDIDTVSYKSYSNSSENLMNSANSNSTATVDLYRSHHLDSLSGLSSYEHRTYLTELARSQNQFEYTYCDNCRELKTDKLNDLLNNLEQADSLKQLLFTGPRYCQCIQSQYAHSDEETKCMNLLVDQIIDLAECKEDYMELEE